LSKVAKLYVVIINRARFDHWMAFVWS